MITEAKVPISTATDDEDQAEIPQRQVENVDHGWIHLFIFIGPDRQGADQQLQGLIGPFASSIGHNHGLFDEI